MDEPELIEEVQFKVDTISLFSEIIKHNNLPAGVELGFNIIRSALLTIANRAMETGDMVILEALETLCIVERPEEEGDA